MPDIQIAKLPVVSKTERGHTGEKRSKIKSALLPYLLHSNWKKNTFNITIHVSCWP